MVAVIVNALQWVDLLWVRYWAVGTSSFLDCHDPALSLAHFNPYDTHKFALTRFDEKRTNSMDATCIFGIVVTLSIWIMEDRVAETRATLVYQQVYELVKTNHKPEASRMLAGLINRDPTNADLWYIATFVTDDKEKRIAA